MSFPPGSHFDWYSCTECSWFDPLIDSVVEEIWAGRSTRGTNAAARNSKYRSLSLHFLFSLYQAYHGVSPSHRTKNVCVSVRKDKGYYASSNLEGNPYGYSYKTLKSVFDAMKATKLIRVRNGRQGRYVTRMYPSASLARYFDELGCRWVEQTPRPSGSLLIGSQNQRNWDYEKRQPTKIKTPIWVDDSAAHEAMRKDLFRINSEIVRHSYTLNIDDTQLAHLICRMTNKEHQFEDPLPPELPAMPFNLFNVQLRRILNPLAEGDLKGGGRFYGGWWQQIPSKQRRLILIDGKLTVEADFSSIHPRILYAEVGVPFPEGDFYDLGLPDWKGKEQDKVRRGAIKRYVNAFINGKRYRLSKDDEGILGVTPKELKELLYTKHAPIKDYFNSGAGLRAQRIDSNIANDVMLAFAEIGEVVLPVHDSFIVRVGLAAHLKEDMREAFRKHVKGAEIGIDEDIIGYPEYFYHTDEEMRAVLHEHAKEGGGVVSGGEIELEKLLRPLSWIQKFGLHR